MTTPIDDLIPRDIDPAVSKVLQEFSSGIEELVNYGSHIIIWDLRRPNLSDEDTPPVLFLRNFIEEIDAISILIKSSSIDPCKTLFRTALENFFYLEYILQNNSQNRSLAYLVWNTINNDKLYTKADGISKEYNELLKKYKQDKFLKNSIPYVFKDAEKMKEIGKSMLALPKYLPIKDEYERTKLKHRNPAWYSLFDGPANLQTLADSLNLHAIYEILYRNLSNSTHGTDIIQGKLSASQSGHAEISQIRFPKDAQAITQNCFNFCIATYRNYIEKRIPDKLGDFQNWYLTIRDFNLKLGEKQIIVTE